MDAEPFPQAAIIQRNVATVSATDGARLDDYFGDSVRGLAMLAAG